MSGPVLVDLMVHGRPPLELEPRRVTAGREGRAHAVPSSWALRRDTRGQELRLPRLTEDPPHPHLPLISQLVLRKMVWQLVALDQRSLSALQRPAFHPRQLKNRRARNSCRSRSRLACMTYLFKNALVRVAASAAQYGWDFPRFPFVSTVAGSGVSHPVFQDSRWLVLSLTQSVRPKSNGWKFTDSQLGQASTTNDLCLRYTT